MYTENHEPDAEISVVDDAYGKREWIKVSSSGVRTPRKHSHAGNNCARVHHSPSVKSIHFYVTGKSSVSRTAKTIPACQQIYSVGCPPTRRQGPALAGDGKSGKTRVFQVYVHSTTHRVTPEVPGVHVQQNTKGGSSGVQTTSRSTEVCLLRRHVFHTSSRLRNSHVAPSFHIQSSHFRCTYTTTHESVACAGLPQRPNACCTNNTATGNAT